MTTTAEQATRPAFLAAWRLPDAEDQWWWLQHPGTTAPSGAPSWEQRLAAAREPLYRRDPDAEAVAAYSRLEAAAARERDAVREVLDGLHAEPPAPPPQVGAAAPGPPRRLVVAGGLVLAAGAVAAGIAALIPRHGPQPIVLTASRLVVTSLEELQLALRFGAAKAAPGLHAEFLRQRLQNDVDEVDTRALARTTWTVGSAVFRAPAPPGEGGGGAGSGALGDGAGTGIRIGDLSTNTVSGRIDDDTGGVVTVVVMLAEAGAWHADLEVDGGRDLRVVGRAGLGTVQFAVTRLTEGATVQQVRVAGPHGVPFVWNVTVRA